MISKISGHDGVLAWIGLYADWIETLVIWKQSVPMRMGSRIALIAFA